MGFAAEQAGHAAGSALPQLMQNRASGVFFVWHLGHSIWVT